MPRRGRDLKIAMLAEAILCLRSLPYTPPRFWRHLPEAAGLWSRGVRQAKAWAPHVANTRGLIDTTIDEIARRRTVAVLGAGPLFDVPLESLARTFGTVLLVDRAHPANAAPRLGRYPNVQRVWRDLSRASGPQPLDFLRAYADLDWVISVNLVSQLARAAARDADEAAARAEVAAHLDGLAALGCRATLVTDTGYRTVDRSGAVYEEVDMLRGRPMPPPDLKWKWEVAPFGEEAADIRRVHDVGAWLDWRGPARG